MLNSKLADHREPLLEPPHRPTTLSLAEKIEFATQSAITLFFQLGSCYYTLTDEELFKQDMALAYLASAIYSFINSGVSIYSLYQLGPYLFNTHQLNENIQTAKHTLAKLVLAEKTTAKQLNQLEQALQRQQLLPYSLLKSRDGRSLLPPLSKSKRISWHKYSENIALTLFEFASQTLNGISAGLNLNQILNMGSTNMGAFIVAPLAFGFSNAAINRLVFEFIRHDTFFIPSQAMMSHALDVTEDINKSYILIETRLHPALTIKINTLSQLIPSESGIPSPIAEQHAHDSQAALQIAIGEAKNNAELPLAKRNNKCVTFCLAATSLLPMLISDLSVIFSAISEAEENDHNTLLYISLALVSFIQVAAFAWRMRRYNDNEGVAALERFCGLTKENLPLQTHQLKQSFFSHHQRANQLLMQARNLKPNTPRNIF